MSWLQLEFWHRLGVAAPWAFVLLFLAASALMLWRLEALGGRGFEGTVLGTLVMPYCSGIGNLVFAYVLGRQGGDGEDVLINSLVNNVTNLTLLIGLPTLIWGAGWLGRPDRANRSTQKARKLNRLSVLLSIAAGLFFTGALWALTRDGSLDFGDGLVLIGIFVFWQVVHVFEVLKGNVRQSRSLSWLVYPDLLLLLIGALGVFVSIDVLVNWLDTREEPIFAPRHLGWVSAWLMVLPNALLAVYYGWRGKPEVVYASQIGDGHICVPLCVGIFAVMSPSQIPAVFQLAMAMVAGALVLHAVLLLVFPQAPKWTGLLLLAGYGAFIYFGFPNS